MFGFRSARGRAILVGVVLTLFLAGVTALTLWRSGDYNRQLDRLERASDAASALEHARAQLYLQTSLLSALAFSQDPSLVEEYRQAQAALERDLIQARAEATNRGDQAQLAMLDDLTARMVEFEAAANLAIPLLLDIDASEAAQMAAVHQPELAANADSVFADLDQLAENGRTDLAAERAAMDREADVSFWLIVARGVAAFVLTAVIATVVLLSILRPLASVRLSARAIAAGNLNARAKVFGPEEVASLARDFNRMTDALAAKTEEYITTTNLTGDVIGKVDAQGKWAFLNDAACQFLGKPRERLLGTDALAPMHPDDRQATAEAVREARANKEPTKGLVNRVVTPMGTRVVEWNAYPVFDKEGRDLGIQITGRDITERNQAEEALRRRDAILEAVSFAASRFLRGDDWGDSIRDVLARLGEATGASRVYVFENHVGQDGELLTSQRYEWAAPGIAAQIDSPDLQNVPWLAGGFARWVATLPRGEPICGHVREFPQSEQEVLGPQHIKSIVVVPIFVREEWWGFIGLDECVAEREWSAVEVEALKTAADILGEAIQRTQTAEALRESEARYRLLAENTSDLIWTMDLSLRYTYVSPAITPMRGYTPEEIVGSTVQETMTPASLEVARKTLAEQLAIERAGDADPNRSAKIELEMYCKDGSTIWTEMNMTFLRDGDGRPVGILGVTRDISERKQAEETLRRRDAILEVVSFAASRFLGTAGWEESIQDVLTRLGQATGVSRIYVFENHVGHDGELLTSHRYEWVAPGVEPQIESPDLQSVPWRAGGFARWVATLTQGEPIRGHVREFPESEQEMLAPQDIKSIVVVPIFVRENWWGFLGFDECVAEREWSAVEVEALKTAADILGEAIQRTQTAEALRESEARYRLLAENTSDVIWTMDLSLRWTYLSPAVTPMRGYTPEEIVGSTVQETMTPASLEVARKTLAEQLAIERAGDADPNRSAKIELEMYCKDGSTIWTEVNMTFLRDADGRPVGILGVTRDISERKQAEEALRESEMRFRQVAEASREWIWEVEAEGRYTYASPAVKEILGYELEEVVGKRYYDFHVADEKEQLLAEDREVLARKATFFRVIEKRVHKDGHIVLVESTGVPVLNAEGEVLGYRGVDEDITERKRAEEERERLLAELETRAVTDSLTGLHNHAYFYERLADEIDRARRYGHRFALVMMDLDAFKHYNDSRGHQAGDAALRLVGECIRSAMRRSDLAFRYGGDEFVTILLNADVSKAQDIVRRINKRIAARLKEAGDSAGAWLGVSAGIACYPADATTVDELVGMADAAMYDAKRLAWARGVMGRGQAVELAGCQVEVPHETQTSMLSGAANSLSAALQDLTTPDVITDSELRTIAALGAAAEIKDPFILGHHERTSRLAATVAKEMGLSPDRVRSLTTAGLLHDLGKISVSEGILNKPGKLTESEFAKMKEHPALGASMIVSGAEALQPLAPIVRHHHEHVDGSGYPDGLARENIPMEARILSVADAFDAMTHERAYRKALSTEEALGEIQRGAGTRFDSGVVEAFLDVVRRRGGEPG